MLGFGGTQSGIYKLLLVLHLLSVIVGIGAVMLNGVYFAQAMRREGPGRRAVSEANFFVSRVAEFVIYTIPVFGILLVIASDSAWSLGNTWIWLSLVLYVVAIGIAHGLLTPSHKRMNALLAEQEVMPTPARDAEIDALGRRQAAAGMMLNVFVVVFLVLMVWKPGR